MIRLKYVGHLSTYQLINLSTYKYTKILGKVSFMTIKKVDLVLSEVFDPNVPEGLFSDEEYCVLVEYGTWLTALMNGTISPDSEKQRHFVSVCRGEAAPKSLSDQVWVRFLQRKQWEANNPEYNGKEDLVFSALGIVGKGWGIPGQFK